MADLFRKSSLDKLSNPEQLDRAITISKPMSWLALIGVVLIIITTIIWSIFGTIPTTTTVNGIVVSPNSVNAIFSDCSGTVEEIMVKSGDVISKDTDIAKIKKSDGKITVIKSKEDGIVSEILCTSTKEIKDKKKDETNPYAIEEVATQVFPGTEIIRVTPNSKNKQVVVCYVPSTAANNLQTGMEVLLFPSSIDTQKYGHIKATISSIGEYPVEVTNMVYVLGDSDNSLINLFASEGPVVTVACEIKVDNETKSGYEWSSKKSKDLTITNGTFVTARIVVDECAPISKLITSLKDKLEG